MYVGHTDHTGAKGVIITHLLVRGGYEGCVGMNCVCVCIVWFYWLILWDISYNFTLNFIVTSHLKGRVCIDINRRRGYNDKVSTLLSIATGRDKLASRQTNF
jgi:hypothetical protein